MAGSSYRLHTRSLMPFSSALIDLFSLCFLSCWLIPCWFCQFDWFWGVGVWLWCCKVSLNLASCSCLILLLTPCMYFLNLICKCCNSTDRSDIYESPWNTSWKWQAPHGCYFLSSFSATVGPISQSLSGREGTGAFIQSKDDRDMVVPRRRLEGIAGLPGRLEFEFVHPLIITSQVFSCSDSAEYRDKCEL